MGAPAKLWASAAVMLVGFCLMARADTAKLSEAYSEKYACRWDCPPEFDDIPDIPFVDRDDLREQFCERICGDRLRVTASLTVVLTLPTLRFLDLRTVGSFSLSVGGLDYSCDEASKSSSNSVTFPQYREEENDDGGIIRHRAGTVVFSKKGDVLTVKASRTTAGESVTAARFTHETGTLDGAINIDQVPLRVEVDGLMVEREIPFKALTKLKTSLVRVETGGEDYEDPEVTEELRTYSTVKVVGTAAWANPILTVTTPVPNQRWSNQVVTASGTVVSFANGPMVWVRLNDAEDWIEISPTNGFWDAALELTPGTNRIFACAVDGAGRFSPGVLVRFVQVRTSPLGLQVNPSPAAGSLAGPTNGQLLEEGVRYLLNPTPAPGYLLEKWELQSPGTGTTEITGIAAPRLSFVHETNLVIRAYFVPNRFLAIRSKYAGLVRPASGTNLPVDAINQGFIRFQLTANGSLKGSYVTARKTFAFASKIHPANGMTQLTFDAGKATEATASVTFDLDNGGWVSGSLTAGDAEWTSVLEAFPEASMDEVLPFAGNHTFAIPGVDLPDVATLPMGHGFGTLKISGKGAVSGVGAAGDGTSLVFSVPLVKYADGNSPARYFWPFFRSERRGGIILRGLIELSSTNTLDAGSLLHWAKQPNFKDPLYPIGFDDGRFAAAGGLREWITARYLAPGRGTNAASFNNGRLILTRGNLPGPQEFAISITPDDKVTVVGPNPSGLTLKFTRTTGGFTGTFLHHQTGKKTKFAGAILQSAAGSSGSNVGFGWFPGWTQTGAVVLEATDAP